MTLEEVLPILKSGTPIARQIWLDDPPPYYFIQRKGLDSLGNPALIDSAGYRYTFCNSEIFADDWVIYDV